MDTRAIFARNLSRLVAERGVEQQALAFALDVSPSIVSSWLSGKRFTRADMMDKLADYFHVDISDIVEEKTEDIYDLKRSVLFKRSRDLNERQLDMIMRLVDDMAKENDRQ